MMDAIRKMLGALLAALGVYYCFLSLRALATLSSTAEDWVRRSGDRDFVFDFELFRIWIAIGAVMVGAFGLRTVVKGVRAARGRRESWLLLAIGAPLLHWFWFLYRTIGNGVLDREVQRVEMWGNGLWFGSVCVAYVAMWFITRQRRSAGRTMRGAATALLTR